jgi:hypothetical protein
MTQASNTTSQPQASLGKRMLIGTAIGLIVISYFLISSGGGDPAWGRFWMIQPLIITPFAGAMGGLCNYIIFKYHEQFGVTKVVATVLSVLVYIVGLWMGVVLGLNGTMWD